MIDMFFKKGSELLCNTTSFIWTTKYLNHTYSDEKQNNKYNNKRT